MPHGMQGRARALGTIALTIVFIMLGASLVSSQAPAKASQAELILDRYVGATGGLAAYDKMHSNITKATLDIPAAGIAIDVTVYAARPNKIRSVAQSPAIGSIERGTDGTIFWEKSTMQGPRILEGEELAEALREAKFEGLVYWRGTYDSVAVAGVDTVGGSPCDKVVMKSKGDKPRMLFFDQKSGLLVKSQTTVASQMGDIPVESFVSDYRKIGDLLAAYKTTMKIMGQERVMTTTSIEYNVAIPDSMFAVPADVQNLLKK